MLNKKPIMILLSTLLIVILSGCGVSQAKSATFQDISDHWAYYQISTLSQKGIITGYGDGTFRPDQTITRAEFITIVNRSYGYSAKAPLPYEDVRVWAWYYQDIARAMAAGYIPGKFGNKLVPNQPLTREEAAAMIAAASQLNIIQLGKLPLQDEQSITSDYKIAVKAVIEAGYMMGYPDGTFRPQAPLTRAEATVLICHALRLDIPLVNIYNVKDFGAKGDGMNHDTVAINNAISAASNAGGGTVYVPEGTYMIPITDYTQIRILSNTKLELADNAIIKAEYVSSTYNFNHATIRIRDVSNVEISGGTITGIKREHDVANEVGHGIAIQGSNNIYIHDIRSNWHVGDGIFIGTSSEQLYCDNVLVEDFICEYNNRQGVTIESARNTTIRNGICRYQYGSNPQSGIDIEPVRTDWFVENVLIENMHCYSNGAGAWWAPNYCYGISVGFGWWYENGNKNPASLTIRNCRLVDNGRDVDDEQINYENIKVYRTKSNLRNINISGITYE